MIRRLAWPCAAVAFSLSLAACGGKSSPSAPSVSPAASTVVVSADVVAADGTTAATVTVTVLDGSGQPMSGQTVRLAYTGTGTVSPATATTDANGHATFTIVSDAGTSGTVAATVNPGPSAVVLAAEPALEFLRVWTSVATGLDHTLALDGEGTLWAWGGNARGELGVPAVLWEAIAPVQVGTGFASIAAGEYTSFAVKTDGTLWAWGVDGCAFDSYPPPFASAPVQIGSGFERVAAGGHLGFAFKADGSVWGWGRNDHGQLLGAAGDTCAPVEFASGYVALTTDGERVFGLKADGSVWAWGGALDVPALIAGGIASISAASFGATTAITTDGRLLVYPNMGTVTAPGVLQLDPPVDLGTAFSSATSAPAAGGNFIVAVRDDGALESWVIGYGQSTAGVPQLGAGFASVSGGYFHFAALRSDGTLWTWGSNESGQLGDGTRTIQWDPVRLRSGVASVSTNFTTTLMVLSDGTLWAAGDNRHGELGDGTVEWRQYPVQIGAGFASACAGGCFSAALKADGTVWTWGWDCNPGSTPAQVASGFVAVACGTGHVLALGTDGRVWSWGGDGGAALGLGRDAAVDPSVPNAVDAGAGFVAVAAGAGHSLALRSDGTLFAWGMNDSGQLGTGDQLLRFTPVVVGTGFARISAGDDHSLAIGADGTLWTWGSNERGQLGLGWWEGAVSSPTPVGEGFAGADGGMYHSLGVKTDGTLWAWGFGDRGSLGNGTGAWANAPVQIGTGFDSVSAGFGQSFALRGDELWGWGENAYGQLGDGGGDRPVPVPVR